MNTRHIPPLLMIIALLHSCSAEMPDCIPSFTKNLVVSIGTSGTSQTRSVMDNSRNMLWAAGDTVRFYCTLTDGGALSGKRGSEKVGENGASVELQFEYNPEKDRYVVVYEYGKAVGSAIENSGSSLLFTGGVPDSQVGGAVPSCHIAVGNESMEKNVVKLQNVQSYVSFSLKNIEMCGGKHINKVTLEAFDEGFVAGDLGVNPKTGESSLSGSSGAKKITLTLDGNAEFAVNTAYYVALLPRTYSGGLKFTYYQGTEVLGILEAKQDIEIETGRIFDLGELRAHSEVMGKSITLLPQKATFLPDMTKKLWVKFSPEDVTRVTWKVVEEKNQSGGNLAAGTLLKPVKSNVEPEYYDGEFCITANVEPKGTKGSCKLIATLEGKALSDTCIIHIDDYVDLGLTSGTLWCAYNVRGSGESGLTLCQHIYDYGDYYMWGWITPTTADNKWRLPDYYMSRWTRSASTRAWNNDVGSTHYSHYVGKSEISMYPTAGKYYSGDGKKQLESVDDAAYYATGKKGRHPTQADIEELVAQTTSGENTYNNILGLEFSGNAVGYTDMYIFIPYAGCVDRAGELKGTQLCLQLRSSTLIMDTHRESPVMAIPPSNNSTEHTGTIGQKHHDLQAYSDDYRLKRWNTYSDFSRIAAFSIRPVRNKW